MIASFPFIGMLAWNQYLWLEELRTRERAQIEANMKDSTQALSKRLLDEAAFTFSVFRIRREDLAHIEEAFAERYRFWAASSSAPRSLRDVFLVLDGKAKRWDGEAFVPAPNAHPNELLAPLAGDRARSFRVIDAQNDLFLFARYSPEEGGECWIVAAIDKEAIRRELLPSLAAQSLQSGPVYRHRVLDAQTSSIIYDSEPDAGTFLPDISFPLLSEKAMSSLRRRTLSAAGSAPDQVGPPFPDEDQQILFPYFVLQVMHKEASLSALARRAKTQNLAITLGTVILLGLAIVTLAETARRTQALATRQREFIATITHELKTPIAIISTAADNLSDGLIRDRAKAEQYGAMIKREAARLGASIEHFLLYASTDAVSPRRMERCAVSDLVDSALRLTEIERGQLGFRTEVIVPDRPVHVLGDRLALESVFQNLVVNAVRHAASGKYLGIYVSCATSRGPGPRTRRVVVRVRDAGPGVRGRDARAIFEPFVRGKAAVETQVPGSGIGLSLARRILAAHGGTISLEGRGGSGGATFVVVLPIATEGSDGIRDLNG